jgi:hypothetical protein
MTVKEGGREGGREGYLVEDGAGGVGHDEEVSLLVGDLEAVFGARALALATDHVKRLRGGGREGGGSIRRRGGREGRRGMCHGPQDAALYHPRPSLSFP